MAAHTERIERFKNAIFKQREEINDRMTKMFGLLKELTTRRTPEKVLIREEAKFPVTKNVNSISLARGEEEREMKFDQLKGKNFKSKHHALVKVEGEMDDEGEVTKTHLLEDKQIPSVGVFDEEIRVTWAHLEKKCTRLRTCTKIHQEALLTEHGDGVTSIKRRRRDLSGDGVWILATTSQRVGSLKAFNSSLLLKWRWRFLKNLGALWVKVVKLIHGDEAGIDINDCQTTGLWASIFGTISHLHSSGIVPLSSIHFKRGDGSLVRFWKDTWLGDDDDVTPPYLTYSSGS
ncbi:hypothetical protein Tco_0520333 [Tanacetum coccineum]